jgi:hypothetical protein
MLTAKYCTCTTGNPSVLRACHRPPCFHQSWQLWCRTRRSLPLAAALSLLPTISNLNQRSRHDDEQPRPAPEDARTTGTPDTRVRGERAGARVTRRCSATGRGSAFRDAARHRAAASSAHAAALNREGAPPAVRRSPQTCRSQRSHDMEASAAVGTRCALAPCTRARSRQPHRQAAAAVEGQSRVGTGQEGHDRVACLPRPAGPLCLRSRPARQRNDKAALFPCGQTEYSYEKKAARKNTSACMTHDCTSITPPTISLVALKVRG